MRSIARGDESLMSSEQATLKAIASMGFPVPPPPRPRRTLKAVAIAVLSTIRARWVPSRGRREVCANVQKHGRGMEGGKGSQVECNTIPSRAAEGIRAKLRLFRS